ncbi:hypothetical protein LJC27_07190, partial [Christensenellaceae bacterium OttesenSCG-928-M15]|nr:hypothetical protein [Christensenellaceae bacterium OttesenSCG-928-M15]
ADVSILSMLSRNESETKVADQILDTRGKLLYEAVQAIQYAKIEEPDAQLIAEKFQPMNSLRRIMFSDVLSTVDIEYFHFLCLDNDTLYYEVGGFGFHMLDAAIKILREDKETPEKELVSSVFSKAGIKTIKKEETEENALEVQTNKFPSWCDLILRHDYDAVRTLLQGKNDKPIDGLFLRLFVGDDNPDECVKCIEDENSFDSKIEEISYLYNSGCAGISFDDRVWQLLWSLDDTEKKHLHTLHDFAHNFEKLMLRLEKITIAQKKKYSPYNDNITHEGGIFDSEFKSLCSHIRSLQEFFICNSIYIYGCSRHTSNGALSRLMQRYIDLLFFFQSGHCDKLKYEKYNMTPSDVSIILNIIDSQDLLHLLQQNELKRLNLSSECEDLLMTAFENVINEQLLRFKRRNNCASFYLADVIKRVCIIIRISSISDENLTRFVLAATKYLEVIINKHDSEYDYVIWKTAYGTLMNMVVEVCTAEKEAIYNVKNAVLSLMNQFASEDLVNQYSRVYEMALEPYHVLYNLGVVLIKANIVLEDENVSPFFEAAVSRFNWYGHTLLIDIYGFVSDKYSEQIRAEMEKRIDSLKDEDLFLALRKQIFEYNDPIEKKLILACERVVRNQKIDDPGAPYSPLRIVALLNIWGIIPSLSAFKKFAEKNRFFNFVCFPESFDYEHFDVSWYSWLGEESHRQKAIKQGGEVMRSKFLEAIENGTTEDIKATYYKYFYTSSQQAD